MASKRWDALCCLECGLFHPLNDVFIKDAAKDFEVHGIVQFHIIGLVFGVGGQNPNFAG